MLIEERELWFDERAPLRAWRLFRIRRDAVGPVLSSPMYHDPLPPPWPNIVAEATCHRGHPAPAAGCRCGIYAAISGTLDSLPGYVLDTAYELDPWAYGEVLCSGRVFVDMRGIRAERAEVIRISLPDEFWRDLQHLDVVRRGLGERYPGVAVEDVAGVPDWLTTNLRDQGAPADDVPLDLDMTRLGMGQAASR